jgi:hypothetical protein
MPPAAGAPAWLAYAAATIALLAMIVATMSYRLARATFKRAGPDIRASVESSGVLVDAGRGVDHFVYLRLTNRGLAPVQIRQFVVQQTMVPFDRLFERRSWFSADVQAIRNGPDLPDQLGAGDSEYWMLNYGSGLPDKGLNGWTFSRVKVELGNGGWITSRTHQILRRIFRELLRRS